MKRILCIGGPADKQVIADQGPEALVEDTSEWPHHACDSDECCNIYTVSFPQKRYLKHKMFFQHDGDVEFYAIDNISPKDAFKIILTEYAK